MSARPTTRHSGPGEAWHLWTPVTAGNPGNEAIADGIEAFIPFENEAGRAAANWLKHSALAVYPSMVTRVLWQDEIVQAFYALSSTTVRLTQRHRPQVTVGAVPLSPVQPATLLAWFGRHREASTSGREILLHAYQIASKVRDLQGSVALVVDPFDEETAGMFLSHYPFRRSAPSESGSTEALDAALSS